LKMQVVARDIETRRFLEDQARQRVGAQLPGVRFR
jgi:hypothetical protein